MIRVPEVSENSTLSELLVFLHTSYQERERIQVEEILANREKALKDEKEKLREFLENKVKVLEKDLQFLQTEVVEVLENRVKEETDFVDVEKQEVQRLTKSLMEMKEKCGVLENEGCLKQQMYEEDLEKLKKELDLMKKEVALGSMRKKVVEDKMEKHWEMLKKMREELERLRKYQKEELERGSDFLEKSGMELEEKMKKHCDVLEKEGELKKNMYEDTVKKLRNNYVKGLKIARDNCAKEKQKVDDLMKSRREFEERQCEISKVEGDLRQKMYGEELKKVRDNYEKELKRQHGLMEKEVEDKMRKQCQMFENERETAQKNLEEDLGKLRDCHKKELERVVDSMRKEASCTEREKSRLEEEVVNMGREYEEKMKGYHVMVNEEQAIMEDKMKAELEILREYYEKELAREHDLKAELEILRDYHKIELDRELDMRNKLSYLALEYEQKIKEGKEEMDKSRENYENELKGERDISILADLEIINLVVGLSNIRMEFEEKLKEYCDVLRVNCEKDLERERDKSKNELIMADLGKRDLVEELRKNKMDFEQRFEALEGKNRDLHVEIELYKERFCIIIDCVKPIKGVCGSSAISGNVRANGDLSNCSNSGDVSMCKWSGKASDQEGRLIKSHISSGGPSSTTPSQTERKCSRGELIAFQLGEKTGCIMENESEDGCYNENLRCTKRRRIDESKYDKDTLAVENTGCVFESVRYKRSHSNGFLEKLDLVGPYISEATPPPRFESASACIKPRTEKSGTDEKSKLCCPKLVNVAVDGIDHCSAHIKGKETTWGQSADMLSAFTNAPELCMAAVVALYRLHISGIGVLTGVDLASATAVAIYLVKGDKEKSLSRSLSEVQQDCPRVLQTCQRLAIKYKEQLLEIYQKKLDPLFCAKS